MEDKNLVIMEDKNFTIYALKRSDKILGSWEEYPDEEMVPEEKIFNYDFDGESEETFNKIKDFIGKFNQFLGEDYDLTTWIAVHMAIKTEDNRL